MNVFFISACIELSEMIEKVFVGKVATLTRQKQQYGKIWNRKKNYVLLRFFLSDQFLKYFISFTRYTRRYVQLNYLIFKIKMELQEL